MLADEFLLDIVSVIFIDIQNNEVPGFQRSDDSATDR